MSHITPFYPRSRAYYTDHHRHVFARASLPVDSKNASVRAFIAPPPSPRPQYRASVASPTSSFQAAPPFRPQEETGEHSFDSFAPTHSNPPPHPIHFFFSFAHLMLICFPADAI